jgi:hypothetical protein
MLGTRRTTSFGAPWLKRLQANQRSSSTTTIRTSTTAAPRRAVGLAVEADTVRGTRCVFVREMTAAGPSTLVLSRLSPSCVAVFGDVDHLRAVTRCSSPRLGAERFLLPRSDIESSERQIERPLHLSAIPSDGCDRLLTGTCNGHEHLSPLRSSHASLPEPPRRKVNRDAKESRLHRGIVPNVRRYRESFVWCRAPLGIRRLSPLGSTVRCDTSRGTVHSSARSFRLFEWCVLVAFRAPER